MSYWGFSRRFLGEEFISGAISLINGDICIRCGPIQEVTTSNPGRHALALYLHLQTTLRISMLRSRLAGEKQLSERLDDCPARLGSP